MNALPKKSDPTLDASQRSASSLTEDILKFAVRAQGTPREGAAQAAIIVAACDLVYTGKLLGVRDLASLADEIGFCSLLSASSLAGTGSPSANRLNVHQTAYALGALNLLDGPKKDRGIEILRSCNWQMEHLIDSVSLLPRWPHLWSHHSWRVSHWIGGAPSILKSLWALMPEKCMQLGMPRVSDVLRSADSLISAESGCLKAYRSELLHALFRQVYRLRHDPDAGDVGGIVHLHWVNYAEGRLPYKAAPVLNDRAWSLMRRAPFIEEKPYCLDFDVVQIVRTSTEADAFPGDVIQRAANYAADILHFMQTRLDDTYALHKLPGALATVHECALICGRGDVFGLAPKPVDIIREAYWI